MFKSGFYLTIWLFLYRWLYYYLKHGCGYQRICIAVITILELGLFNSLAYGYNKAQQIWFWV